MPESRSVRPHRNRAVLVVWASVSVGCIWLDKSALEQENRVNSRIFSSYDNARLALFDRRLDALPTLADVTSVGTHMARVSSKDKKVFLRLAADRVREYRFLLSPGFPLYVPSMTPQERERRVAEFSDWLSGQKVSSVTFVLRRLHGRLRDEILFVCVDDRLWRVNMGKPWTMRYDIESFMESSVTPGDASSKNPAPDDATTDN